MSSEKPNTRTRILDATWQMLESGNGSQVRMSDIAKAVGISRQALYLHFPGRAELLIATTLHIDEVKGIQDRMTPSRAAKSGPERLRAFIDAWGGYIPEIHGVSVGLRQMQGSEAREAWAMRMNAMKEGCAAAVAALAAEGALAPHLTQAQATDLLWSLLSVEFWERLRRDCGWSQRQYLDEVHRLSRAGLIA